VEPEIAGFGDRKRDYFHLLDSCYILAEFQNGIKMCRSTKEK